MATEPGLVLLYCGHCGVGLDARTPFVRVVDAVVRTYCSSECMAGLRSIEPAAPPPPPSAPSWRTVGGKLAVIGLGIASMSAWGGRGTPPPAHEPAPIAAPAMNIDELPLHGPHPLTDEDRAELLARELANETWIHPLPGPVRRMPARDSRVFGAERHGDRPLECRSGHCGVDIGGEVWGEPVFAVHKGVIERVERRDRPNGGMYVRIAHREGAVFTQYFHLAAIPKWLREGASIDTGDVVGLVGDTGVRSSGPHLHFTLSVQPHPDAEEIHVDPEPLIALWPLRVPRHAAVDDTCVIPGVPRGAAGRRRR